MEKTEYKGHIKKIGEEKVEVMENCTNQDERKNKN